MHSVLPSHVCIETDWGGGEDKGTIEPSQRIPISYACVEFSAQHLLYGKQQVTLQSIQTTSAARPSSEVCRRSPRLSRRLEFTPPGENRRVKDGASFPEPSQARSGGTDKTHSGTDSPAPDKGRLPQPLPTRDQAERPRHSPRRLPRPALLTCSSGPPPSALSGAAWTATSRSARPFPAFPPRAAHVPPTTQTNPGPRQPPPPSTQPPTLAAPAHRPAPAPAGPTPAGARASVHGLRGGPRNPMGREEAQGGTGKGGEKSGASPTGGSDWLWIPAETAAPPPPTPGTSRPLPFMQ